MRRFSVFVLALWVISPVSVANGPRDVPEKMFGISLGGVYDIGNGRGDDHGNLPVKKATGAFVFLSNGLHYYFQPKAAPKFYKYVERRKKPSDKYFETSFRLYLLPVIPDTIETTEQLNNEKLNWEVSVIEWSGDKKDNDDGYYWAVNICKTFAVDIAVTPEITDNYDIRLYECTFSAGDREFKVSSMGGKRVQLAFKREVLEKKDESVENVIRKLQANDIRPY